VVRGEKAAIKKILIAGKSQNTPSSMATTNRESWGTMSIGYLQLRGVKMCPDSTPCRSLLIWMPRKACDPFNFIGDAANNFKGADNNVKSVHQRCS
jgi:hypothetical protein